MEINIYICQPLVGQTCRHAPHAAGSQTPATVLLSDVLQRQMELAATKRSASTRANYLTAMRSLLSYVGPQTLLSDIDHMTIEGYERWLRRRGVCQNTASCYMRSLRALLTEADERLTPAFANVFRGSVRTRKRSLPLDAIARLKRLDLSRRPELQLARDVFLFSFYAMGMPFVDIAHLKRSQITADAIVYHRQKTGHRVSVALHSRLTDLIRRYEHRSERYVFPLLDGDDEADYALALGRYNRRLHRLGRMLGLDMPLTSYVARHTWASAAYRSDVGLAVISGALGHASTQTTMTYIRDIDDQTIAEANRHVISLIADEPV